LETGQSNSKVSHQIIEIRYEIPNQVRKQVRKLQTILTVNFKNKTYCSKLINIILNLKLLLLLYYLLLNE
jgi:hypothetical protein